MTTGPTPGTVPGDVPEENGQPSPSGRRAWLRDHSELGVSVLLLALGVLVLTDALTMQVDIAQRGPVGPRTVPLVIGGGLGAASEALVAKAEETYRRTLSGRGYRPFAKIKQAELGPAAGLIGAADLARFNLQQ